MNNLSYLFLRLWIVIYSYVRTKWALSCGTGTLSLLWVIFARRSKKWTYKVKNSGIYVWCC